MKKAKAKSNIKPLYGNMKKSIASGTVVEYRRITFRNGENWLILTDNTKVPLVFFEML
jgi:hypothetical protein